MIHSPGVTALLDACVLYPAPIRDLLLYLASEKLYIPRWTDKIHQEWTRNLLINRPDLTAGQLQATVDAMNRAFPAATITRYESLISSIHLPDPNDDHVLAAALRGQAAVIITANLKDFPNAYLSQYDIEAQHPDQFVANLVEIDPEAVVHAFQAQVASLRKPPKTVLQVLETLRTVGLETTVEKLRSLL